MLYVWAYMIFFSFPIIAPRLLGTIFGQNTDRFPRAWVVLLFSAAAVVVVHFNTIVHPFTLADNRHYVFYAFRLLLRHPAIKYFAAPIYVFCGYLALQALGSPTRSSPAISHHDGSNISQQAKQKGARRSLSPIPDACRASFVIVWTATTALSLITAPLVEPRYCIIPWVMWRLHVASGTVSASANSKKQENGWYWLLGFLQQDSSRLVLETIWFGAVNFATGYLFLYRGFTWEQEPGKVQRFMW
jgi:alpha-1,2-glucosyltransferase